MSQVEAFATEAQKNKRKKRDLECFNCHKKGHIKTKCWVKGGGKEGQGLKKKAGMRDGTTSAIEDADVEAWAIIKEAEESTVEVPCSLVMVAKESPDIITVETELYDSGVLRHMSPFHNKFVMYQPIPPHPIVTADKCTFYAEGVGDLQINVPNREVLTLVLLKDTLHVPQIGLTVMSISCIAKAVLRSRPTCHGIRRTVIDTARESIHFPLLLIILRLDPCQTGLLQPC